MDRGLRVRVGRLQAVDADCLLPAAVVDGEGFVPSCEDPVGTGVGRLKGLLLPVSAHKDERCRGEGGRDRRLAEELAMEGCRYWGQSSNPVS